MNASNNSPQNPALRRQFLLATLTQHGSLEVAEAAAHLRATPITIRRDLAQLAAQGLLVRTHGGAVLPEVVKNPVAFSRKQTVHLDQKKWHLGNAVARGLRPGQWRHHSAARP